MNKMEAAVAELWRLHPQKSLPNSKIEFSPGDRILTWRSNSPLAISCSFAPMESVFASHQDRLHGDPGFIAAWGIKILILEELIDHLQPKTASTTSATSGVPTKTFG
jgi:hypothetical protein